LSTTLDAAVVLVFGDRDLLATDSWRAELTAAYPRAHIVGCSGAGEIADVRILDATIVATAVSFSSTRIKCVSVVCDPGVDSRDLGIRLAQQVRDDELAHVLVFSDGLEVNGSHLVEGLSAELPESVTVTGGLSADGERFEQTLVVCDGPARSRAVVALGLCGSKLRVGCASLGGWDPFGPERLITRSEGNILFELDGKSALGLYKEYLGDQAAGLPATGLLFPLSLRGEGGQDGVVRTILSVDEQTQSMTFAGDVSEGRYARLMKANVNRLLDGAVGAARASRGVLGDLEPDLLLLISCVGRRMVLRQRTEEEVEAVREVVGDGPALAGFYSYGELSPFAPDAKCELHNQTMTITALTEIG